MLSKRVSEINIQTRLRVDKVAWPPELPKTFTPLVLIQHQDHRNLCHVEGVATSGHHCLLG